VKQTFGPFELEVRLGRGGSAEVWRAVRRGPHGFTRTVALKRLLPELRHPRLSKALLEEARLAARLEHQNIAQVLEVVDVAGEPAIVMELVDGCELRALMKALAPFGPPGPGLGAFVAHEVCRALACAHAERPPILHRDVSPTNVLLARSGAVKLADFGIGKVLHDGDDKTRSFKGNLGYMAPEQLARQELSPAADVYAAGVLLWEMLTGKRLFTALDLEGTGDARLKPIAAPSTLNPAVPHTLDNVVARALNLSPDLRFADGAAMAEALAPIAHELGFGPTQLASLVRDHAPPSPEPEPEAEGQPLRHTETHAPAAPLAPPINDAPAKGRRWGLGLLIVGALGIVGAGAAVVAWRLMPPIGALPPPPLPVPAIVAPPPIELIELPPPTTTPAHDRRRRRHHSRAGLVDGKLVDPFHR
jgi:serine/threonine-protein kinase